MSRIEPSEKKNQQTKKWLWNVEHTRKEIPHVKYLQIKVNEWIRVIRLTFAPNELQIIKQSATWIKYYYPLLNHI